MTNVTYQPTEEEILDIAPDQIEVKTYDELIVIGDISGQNIIASNIKGGTLNVGSGDKVLKYDSRYGFWLGDANFDDAPFSVDLEGNVIATSLTIGGWSVNTTSIYTGTEDHSGYTANAGDITLYSSGTVASLHAKNWYIDTSGNLTCQSATIGGSTISTPTITGIQTGSEIAIQGWQHDMAFTADSNVQLSWASGTITLLDGTTYNITGANTGTMSAINYIYLDIASSITVLQTTTTAATAVGTGKILIAVAQNVASGKLCIFQVFGGKALGGLGKLIVASDITANTITANEIYANTITAAQIAANTITASEILANTITAAEIAATTITGTQISSLSISGKSIVADTGTIGSWVLGSTTIKSAASGNTYIELDQSVPHIKMQGSTSGDVIQMQVTGGAPLLEAYTAGTIRMRLAEDSLKFYDSSGNLRSTLTGGTTGSGTTGLVGTNSMYFPTFIASPKFSLQNTTTTYLTISLLSGDNYFATSNLCRFQGGIESDADTILFAAGSDRTSTQGNIFFHTGTGRFRGYDGSNWRDICFYDERNAA